uniref:Uncharacterized protein n=1 Tax=Taeniopygia guttata TaxID=59729 RepID=A0A674H9N3_TAEGU
MALSVHPVFPYTSPGMMTPQPPWVPGPAEAAQIRAQIRVPGPGPVPAASAAPGARQRALMPLMRRDRHLLHARVSAHTLHIFFPLSCWVLLYLTGYSGDENSSLFNRIPL